MAKYVNIYVEGHTERAFLNQSNMLFGKVIIFNFWEKHIKSKIRQIKANTSVIVIFDTDAINDTNLALFLENLTVLSNHCNDITLIQQNKNLEDELARACGIKTNALFKAFKAQGRDEFKANLLKTNNISSKLETLNFDFNKLWIATDFYDKHQHKLPKKAVKFSRKFNC